jgi:tRNA threonylcarbamoyladenosine biosynthesis protein TsaB
MLVLVTDTSGKDGFVGLARKAEDSGSDDVEVIEEVPLAGGTFSAQLVPQISSLLGKHHFRKSDIDAFIVVSGPGSFTGLRVGLAAIKALAEILHKPIVAVSLLEVMASSSRIVARGDGDPNAPAVFRYAIALDAGRGEAFVGQYEVVMTSKAQPAPWAIAESLLSIDGLSSLTESGTVQWIATPDEGLAAVLVRTIPKTQAVRHNFGRPRTAEVAAAGLRKLSAGGTVSPEELDANYIRRSDAEIFAKPGS